MNYAEREQQRHKAVAIARRLYADGGASNIQIDLDPQTANGADGIGVFVQAWVFVSADQIKELS